MCVCVLVVDGGGDGGGDDEGKEERMSEGWWGVALATGSGVLVSPAGANRDNKGVLGGGESGEQGGEHGGGVFQQRDREPHLHHFNSPSILCACFSSSFVSDLHPSPFPHLSPSVSCSPLCLLFLFFSFQLFHFNHHFPFQLHQSHSFQQLPAPFFPLPFPSLSLLHFVPFPLFFSIFASLFKPPPLFHPFILSSTHRYSTSRWIENKVLQWLSRWRRRKKNKEADRQENKSWGDGEGKGEKGGKERERGDVQINTCVCQVVFFPTTLWLCLLLLNTDADTLTLWPWTQPLLPFKVVFSHSKLSLPQLPWPFCRLWQSLFMKHSAKGQILHRRFMHFENPMLIKIQMPKAWALIDTKKTQGLYLATSHQCGRVQTWSTWLQICSCTFVSSLKKSVACFCSVFF